jgi:hypothetical protein
LRRRKSTELKKKKLFFTSRGPEFARFPRNGACGAALKGSMSRRSFFGRGRPGEEGPRRDGERGRRGVLVYRNQKQKSRREKRGNEGARRGSRAGEGMVVRERLV